MSKINWKAGTMIYPIPAVLVSCGKEEKDRNLITIAWTGIISSTPAQCYVSIRPERHSYHIIKQDMAFVINLTTEKLAFATDWCGVRSGRDYNKFKEMNLSYSLGQETNIPVLDDSPISLECVVTEITNKGSHDLFLANIVNVIADDRFISSETGALDLKKTDPLVYCHGNYYGLGEKIGKFGWSVEKKKK